MNTSEATQKAHEAMDEVTVTETEMIGHEAHQTGPVNVAETTVLFLNRDGTYCVADNGESVDNLSQDDAVRIIVENLTDE